MAYFLALVWSSTCEIPFLAIEENGKSKAFFEKNEQRKRRATGQGGRGKRKEEKKRGIGMIFTCSTTLNPVVINYLHI